MSDYRASHATESYGAVYRRTYQTGYYRAQWEVLERPLVTAALARLRASGATSLLDFACGTGRLTRVAEGYFDRVVGVDVSAPMLEVARTECRSAELVERDLTRSPLEERFAVVTAFRFFLNAEPELRSDALKAIRRQLTPGGTLLANIHVNGASPLGIAYRVRNRIMGRGVANTFGLAEMHSLLEAHGYRIERVDWYSFLPRVGWLFPPGSEALMTAVERVAHWLPPRWQRWGQSFLIEARATVDP